MNIYIQRHQTKRGVFYILIKFLFCFLFFLDKVQARIHLLKESLHPSDSPSQRSRCEYCRVLEPTNPQFFQIQKSNWELKLVFAFGFPWRSPQLRETRGTNSGPPCRFNISGRKYGWCIWAMQFCCHGLMFIPANSV